MGDRSTIRVIIVAPTLAVRAGLRFLLESEASFSESALNVVVEVSSLLDLGPEPPETDILLLSEDAVSTSDLEKVISRFPQEIALLLLTENRVSLQELTALPLRSWGILTPDTSAEELLAAVRALNEGLLVGTPALMQLAYLQTLSMDSTGSHLPAGSLTERESEVLQLLSHGLANKQIANVLGISEHTVKFHVSSIYTKLGATNRAEAVRRGVQSGLVAL